MRRIFGGTSLTGSSTSGSLSSDALPSPASPTHERSPPLTPVYETSFRRDEEPAQEKKGWFGGLVRNGSAASQASTAGGIGGGGADSNGRSASSSNSGSSSRAAALDDLDPERLPFGASRSPNAIVSSPRNGHFRQTSRSSASLGSAFGASGSSSRPFSPEGVLAENAVTVPKDAIMVELLSGQAAIEAKDFDVLEWDQVQELKKEHAVLANRIASLSRSVALETRLRDSAAKLVRLSAPASSLDVSRSQAPSPARRTTTREQAEAQLETAQAKLDSVQAELYKVGWKEAELRTKILKHTAGVLALSVRKRDEDEQGLPHLPLSPALPQHAMSSSQFRDTPSPTGSGRNATPATEHRFDGAHFFAGNREAVVPLSRSTNSPFTSPAPSQGAFAQQNLHHEHVQDLEAQVTELRNQLELAKGRAAQDVAKLRNELDDVKRERAAHHDRNGSLERDLDSLRVGLQRAEEDVARARHDAEEARKSAATQRSTEDVTARAELEAARREAEEARGKIADLERHGEDLERELSQALEKVRQLEDEVREVRQEKDHSESEWAKRLEEVETRAREQPERHGEETEGEREAQQRIAFLEADRRKLAQAIGDVVRRHRTRPVLGSVLRETPGFDDTTDRDDLASYLASTLDAHFDKVSTHVTRLNDDVSSLQCNVDTGRQSLESDLAQANDRHAALENELESLRMEKDLVQESLDSAEARARDVEVRLGSIPNLEGSLSTAQANETHAREELAAAQAKVSALEGQIAEVSAQQAKTTKSLQDLFKAIPPLDTRPLPDSTTDQFASLKNAFDPNARRQIGNFIADITSGSGKFSIEGLAERIKLLIGEDHKLVQKLTVFETERANVEKSRMAIEERTGELQASERKIKELEERIEVSSKQEVTMLERLNDLTESLEQSRNDKRKLEAQIAQLQAQPPPTAAPVQSSSNDEVEELRDQIMDLEEELKDAKAREQKVRSQLLDELSTVQSEVSSLKTQLRQAQRKMGK
ncbi:hypothetical protein JCM10212_002443 [Sporobolomyces blumeae]